MTNNMLQNKEKRIELYKKLESERNSKLLVYITSDRSEWGAQIGEDAADYNENLEFNNLFVENIKKHIFNKCILSDINSEETVLTDEEYNFIEKS